jgi:hypothetical protein
LIYLNKSRVNWREREGEREGGRGERERGGGCGWEREKCGEKDKEIKWGRERGEEGEESERRGDGRERDVVLVGMCVCS